MPRAMASGNSLGMVPSFLPKRFALKKYVPKRLILGAAYFLVLPCAPSAWADVPPIGYVGSVDRAPSNVMPPLGYVGPVDGLPTKTVLPIGYLGPVPHTEINKPLAAADDSKADHAGETLITAKQMHSDSESGITTATGKVEIVRGDYVLHADKVVYNQKTGVMTADGHVAILMPTGEVEFADHQEITGDMKQAFAQNIGILFPDNSRMAAQTSQRYEGRYTVADQAVYTACNVCKEHPEKEPIWQMDATSITHDNEEHKVYYHNATIDIAGVPVAYTPYMSGPDPTVKRLQGFLSPTPGISPNIGTFIKVPYYIDIAPDKDATIAPTFSTTDKVQMAGEYRERFERGQLLLSGSITQADLVDDSGLDKGQKWRGDFFGTGLYDLDSIWRAGFDAQYASDKSYLHRYDISSLDQTTSRGYVEGFNGRDYAVVNSYYFQDLRAGVDSAEPIVIPSASFSSLGDPGQTWGGRWSLDGNTLVTSRNNSNVAVAQQGPDMRRLSLNGGWQRQLISDTGLVTTVSGLARTDNYWANNIVAADGSGTVYNQAMFSREFAQANAVMRYPMGRSGDGYQQLFEPIVAVTGAPNVRIISKQPIEDSLDVEFDETNLFSPNRFTGSDLIEGGSRVTYGARNAFTMDSGGRIDIFGGESYDFTTNSQFPEESGLNGHASDYVGRIDYSPIDWFNANYGFRLGQSDLSFERQDALVSVGAPVFRPYVRYIQAYETDPTTELIDQVRQVTLGFSSTFLKYWTLTGSHVQAFDPQPGPRGTGLNLSYADECIAYGVSINRDDTSRADISSGTSISFHLFLKNLGGIHTDSATNITFPAQFRQTEP